MNYISILSDLITQLESHYKQFFLVVSKEEILIDEDSNQEINERYLKIKTLTDVIHKQIQKSNKF